MRVMLVCGDCGCRGFRLEECQLALEDDLLWECRDIVLVGTCPYCKKVGRVSVKTMIRHAKEGEDGPDCDTEP